MITNKGAFIEALSEDDFNKGCVKFNIPPEENPTSLNGEGIWGWCTPEDKERYNDGTYHGKITAILSNTPIEYYGRLNWADEVVLQCHGGSRPTLDPEWVKENLKGEQNELLDTGEEE